jgi:hypothetical protein
MQFSPTVRWLLTGLFAGLTVLATQLPSLTGLPEWVGPALAALTAVGAALGLIPPQTGGTQQGVVSPAVTEPPEADVQRGYAPGSTLGFFWPVAALPLAADELGEGELGLILVILGIACLLGAAYLGYLRNVIGALIVGAIGLILLLVGL